MGATEKQRRVGFGPAGIHENEARERLLSTVFVDLEVALLERVDEAPLPVDDDRWDLDVVDVDLERHRGGLSGTGAGLRGLVARLPNARSPDGRQHSQ